MELKKQAGGYFFNGSDLNVIESLKAVFRRLYNVVAMCVNKMLSCCFLSAENYV